MGRRGEIEQLPKLLFFNFARQTVLAQVRGGNISAVMESAAALKSMIDSDKCKLKDLSKPELIREARCIYCT